MAVRYVRILALLAAVALTSSLSIQAARQQVSLVPDIVGLSLPRATATLNAVGIGVGSVIDLMWSEASGLPLNSVGAQSALPGDSVPMGTRIDLVVLRQPNITLLYDENGLAVHNHSNTTLALPALAFTGISGNTAAAFAGERWAASLPDERCAYLARPESEAPATIPGCSRIDLRLTTEQPAEQFWTTASGVTNFNVLYQGEERGTCPAAPAGSAFLSCPIHLPIDLDAESTDYLFMAYTTERLIVFNPSQDRFMPLDEITIINNAAGGDPALGANGDRIAIGDASQYVRTNPVAAISTLAPQQCILFTNSANLDVYDTLQACTLVAQLNIDPNLIFWAAPFSFTSQLDGQQRTCPAATPGRLTLCVMPR